MPHNMRVFLTSRWPHQRTLSYVIAMLLGLCAATPVSAHLTSLRARLLPVTGAPILLNPSSQIELTPHRGGESKFKIKGVTDSLTGKPVTAADNTITVDLVINGVSQPQVLTFALTSGRASGSFPSLDLVATDLVEVKGVTLRDQNGALFGVMGVKIPGPPLSSAIIQAFDSPSPIQLAPTRDADVTLKTSHGGVLTVRLDAINPPDASNNRLELEIKVNGAPLPFYPSFDIVDGNAKVEVPLGLTNGDLVEVTRLDLYDAGNVRFATLGVRIMSPAP